MSDELKSGSGGAGEPPERWLEGLPSPDKDEAGWEASAKATEQAVANAGAEATAAGDLLEAPKLDAEPGEPSSPGADAAPLSGPASGPVSGRGPRSGRGSLKDLAQRTAARTPLPGAAEPSPVSKPTPSTATPSGPVSASPTSARGSDRSAVRRAAEAGDDDSGFVNLKAVHGAATPEQDARASKTELGSADLLDDEMASVPPGPASSEVLSSGHVDFAAAAAASGPASSAGPASQPANDTGPASAAPQSAAAPSAAGKAPPSSNSNTWLGLGIAVAGIAAAVALWVTMGSKPVEGPTAQRSSVVEAPAEGAAAGDQAAPSEAQKPDDEKKPGGLSISDLDDATVDALGDDEESPSGGAVAVGPGKPAPDAPEGKKTGKDEPSDSGEKGDLGDEMAKAAGADDDDDDGEEPVPAAADPKDKNQSIPEAPPQGKVQAAIGSVLGGARACVAGGDDVSRATITFGSSGAVKSVSVSGWAAGKGAAGCIKSALKGANVGRFARPSYTVGVTVRP